MEFCLLIPQTKNQGFNWTGALLIGGMIESWTELKFPIAHFMDDPLKFFGGNEYESILNNPQLGPLRLLFHQPIIVSSA